MPRSMCSEIPKPKLPVSLKLRFRSSYSLTLRPRSRISSALGPRTVTWTAIFSLRRIPKVRTVYLALPGSQHRQYILFSKLRAHRVFASRCRSTHTVDWRLTAQLLQHLGRSCQSVTRLADGDVEDELLDAELLHGVVGLVGAAGGLDVLAIGLLSRGFAFGLQSSCISCYSAVCHPHLIHRGMLP